MAQKAAYRDHISALREVLGHQPWPRVILIQGGCTYLVESALAKVRKAARDQGVTTLVLEGSQLTASDLAVLGGQGALFEPKALLIVRRSEAAKSLPKILAELPALAADPQADGGSTLCLVHGSDTVGADLKAALQRHELATVPCATPWPSDLPQVVMAQSQAHGLALAADAVRLLVAAHGDDLIKHDNELRRIALIWSAPGASAQRRSTPMTAEELLPHLGMLRQDEALRLGDHLLRQEWPMAHIVVHDLLERGESPLAVLGVIAGFCRRALRTLAALERGAPLAEVAQAVKLPPSFAKIYAQHLSAKPARWRPRPLLAALELCQQSDMRLKSTAICEQLIIADVLTTLAQP